MITADLAEARSSAHRPRALLDRTSLGTLALTGASALRLALQFLMMPVLARLIGPSEYGLVALAMPFILLANVVADGGLALALGRQASANRELESTAFWIATGLGAGLAATCALTAYPIGLIVHQPRLPHLILALSPILLMNSLTAANNGRIVRERRFAVFAAGDLISTVAAAVTAFAAALHGCGAWSLVAQQLVLWVSKLSWVTIKGGVRIGFLFNWPKARALVQFGVHGLGASVADFIARNVDNLIVGAVLGSTQLGYYAMAYQIIRIPDMLISGPAFFYIMTAVSRATHRGDLPEVRRLARGALRLAWTGVAPLFCGLALVADLAVEVVLGPKWRGAIDALRFLAGAGFCFSMCSPMSAVVMGVGRSGLQMRMSMALGLTTIVTVGGAATFGVSVVSAALASGVAIVWAAYFLRLARELKIKRVVLAASAGPAVAGMAALALAVVLARRMLAHADPSVQLIAAVLLGAGAYLLVVAVFARRLLVEDLRAFGRAHADAPTGEPAPAAPNPALAAERLDETRRRLEQVKLAKRMSLKALGGVVDGQGPAPPPLPAGE